VGDDDDPEDISMTAKEIAKVEKIKAKKALENPSKTFQIACPDCACDYFIPLMKAFFTKSFAGNRFTVSWPNRHEGNDSAVLCCPACYIIYSVKEDGTIVKTGKKLKDK
jgi:hypothetical protein